ncbi:hypothetical protein K7W42_19855 [Deinococcus sp. HMF7604]|uniref:hypothetical protein n=1 Tax=Deinococcus betulae TaxID=2873312 RepID=UPI001CCD3807|nr:hypothetical protein [Deinococcus betulae]MBZ9753096.1 hypothetical protein [Deinococcus betulae]
MVQIVRVLALAAAVGVGGAQAVTLEFGVSYARPVGSPLWAEAGVSDLPLLGGTVTAVAGTRAARLGYVRGLALPPLGAVSVSSDLTVTWQGGVRLASRASGSVGPLALNLGAAAFTTSATAADPNAAFTETATDLRERGISGDLTLRYRLSREVVAVVGGEFGAQPHLLAGVEGRRVLTRPVQGAEAAEDAEPMAADSLPDTVPSDTLPTEPPTSSEVAPDEPAPDESALAEPEVELVGTLSWRLGARAGRDVLGLSGGLSYATEAGLTLALDALVGPHTLGLTGSAAWNEVLGEGSTLRLYAAYEPWRTVSSPLRAGVEATLAAGPGTLGVQVNGGRRLDGAAGVGLRVSYALPLAGTDSP